MKPGIVYWVTGLSGAGKTTIGRLLYQHIAATKSNVLFLDGDALREIFGDDLGHSIEDRRKSAMRNARLCKALSDQGLDVVCATISLFHDCQNWNRKHIANYKEIFLDVPMDLLIKRDSKKLYGSTPGGRKTNVVGIDVAMEKPLKPDVIVYNDGSKPPETVVQELLEDLKLHKPPRLRKA